MEERLKEYFNKTGFDAIEIYLKKDGLWTCCIMTGSEGEPKPTINEAIQSAITEVK